MEFFRVLPITTTEITLQETLTLNDLDSMSNEIFIIGDLNQEEATIGGLWGEFTLTRKEIKGGLRFALLECPNALTWTITTGYPPEPNTIIIHLTINRKEKDLSFIEEVDEFLDDHMGCLHQVLS